MCRKGALDQATLGKVLGLQDCGLVFDMQVYFALLVGTLRYSMQDIEHNKPT